MSKMSDDLMIEKFSWGNGGNVKITHLLTGHKVEVYWGHGGAPNDNERKALAVAKSELKKLVHA